MSTPKGWSSMRLDEILGPEQIDAVVKILKSTSPSLRVKMLDQYLTQYTDELTAKGVLPKYLAYVIESMVTSQQAEMDRNQLN